MMTPDEIVTELCSAVKAIVFGLIVFILTVFLIGIACGQEFDGICRLSCNGKQWSGVAISPTQILSVAHPGEETGIRAEFPERMHGSFTRIGVEATVVRSDADADLALLSYTFPKYTTVKTYVISDVRSEHYLIRGYVQDQPMMMKTNLLSQDEVLDGHRVLTLRGLAIHGMSGSPVTVDTDDNIVMGIQFGITKTDTNAVSAETIIKFLEAK